MQVRWLMLHSERHSCSCMLSSLRVLLSTVWVMSALVPLFLSLLAAVFLLPGNSHMPFSVPLSSMPFGVSNWCTLPVSERGNWSSEITACRVEPTEIGKRSLSFVTNLLKSCNICECSKRLILYRGLLYSYFLNVTALWHLERPYSSCC